MASCHTQTPVSAHTTIYVYAHLRSLTLSLGHIHSYTHTHTPAHTCTCTHKYTNKNVFVCARVQMYVSGSTLGTQTLVFPPQKISKPNVNVPCSNQAPSSSQLSVSVSLSLSLSLSLTHTHTHIHAHTYAHTHKPECALFQPGSHPWLVKP